MAPPDAVLRLTAADPAAGRLDLLRWYYAATPAFWLLDIALDLPLRAAFVDAMPLGKHAYYALCGAIGVAGLVAPRRLAGLARVESVANIVFLILSVGVWYFGMLDWAASESATVAVPTPFHLANFVLAAGAAIVSYRLRWPGMP